MVKEVTRQSPAEPKNSGIHLYSVHDPIPLPEVTESDSEAAWTLWDDSLSAQSRGPATDFKSTVPVELPSCLVSNSLKRNL
jgi:hypothetical protein